MIDKAKETKMEERGEKRKGVERSLGFRGSDNGGKRGFSDRGGGGAVSTVRSSVF